MSKEDEILKELIKIREFVTPAAPAYGKVPELDQDSIEDVDDDGFMRVNGYAALWKPKINPDEDAYGVVYIYSDHITHHAIKNPRRRKPTDPEYIECPGCPKELHCWTSFRVYSPQELTTILDILKSEEEIKFRPTDYAIKTKFIFYKSVPIDKDRVRHKTTEIHKLKI